MQQRQQRQQQLQEQEQRQQRLQHLFEEAGGLNDQDASSQAADLLVLKIAELHMAAVGVLIPEPTAPGVPQPHCFNSQPGLMLTVAINGGPATVKMDYREFLQTHRVPDRNGQPTTKLRAEWVAERGRNMWDLLQDVLYTVMPQRTTPKSRADRIMLLAPYVSATLALMHIPAFPELAEYTAGSKLYHQLQVAMAVPAIPKLLLDQLAGIVKLNVKFWPGGHRKLSASLVRKPADPLTRTAAVVKAFLGNGSQDGPSPGDWSLEALLEAMRVVLKDSEFRAVTEVSSGPEWDHKEPITGGKLTMPAGLFWGMLRVLQPCGVGCGCDSCDIKTQAYCCSCCRGATSTFR